MTQLQDDLDRAIDSVAKRLTHVEDDAQFAARIVSSLPEGQTWIGWLTTSWAPRVAVLAIAAATSVVLINRDPLPVTGNVLASSRSTIHAELRPIVKPSQPLEPPLRTKPLEPLEPLELLEPQVGDHEYSLPALGVEALPPMNLPVDASIELAPLAIGDLPLSGEFPEKY